jgi:hypothetical protein
MALVGTSTSASAMLQVSAKGFGAVLGESLSVQTPDPTPETNTPRTGPRVFVRGEDMPVENHSSATNQSSLDNASTVGSVSPNINQNMSNNVSSSSNSSSAVNQSAQILDNSMSNGTGNYTSVANFTDLANVTESSSMSARAKVRLEMAKRALYGEDDDSNDVQDDDQDPADNAFDSDLISGASADLSQEGYVAVAAICCPLEMSVFTTRLIIHLGFVVCDEGSLQGLVAWYYCKNQTRSFEELVSECVGAADGECAWIGTESQCPERSPNCPTFPEKVGTRRRTCGYRKSANTATTTGEPGASSTAEAEFYCEPSRAVAIDIARSTVTLNNLGGAGPDGSRDDQQRLIYQGVGTFEGSSVDLVVKTSSDYVPWDSSANGIESNVGAINLKSGHSVELIFQFRYTASEDPVTLPEFYFSWMDIDDSDVAHQERIYVAGFTKMIVEEIYDFEKSVQTDGRTLIKSLIRGHSWDNPTDPMGLSVVADPDDPSETVDQRKRAVMLVFRDTAQFTVTLEVLQPPDSEEIGRIFRFAGETSLIEHCPIREDPDEAP